MNVQDQSAVTLPMMAIREVQVSQGDLSARIDVFYTQSYEAHTVADKCKGYTEKLTCMKNRPNVPLSNDVSEMGKVSFILMKGHDKLHQTIQLPKLHISSTDGLEVFAKWEPQYDQIGHAFWTDANGYDLIEREVFRKDSDEAFSASFYPVDASITMHDYFGKRSFTVWNDRPQAGSV